MYENELACALNLAREAGEVQKKGAAGCLKVTIKNDASPVTAVDRACEELIKSGIFREFPEDAFLGEESGAHQGTSGRRWIVDPLDGTRPFIRGIPTYSVLIALEHDGVPVVGVMYLPALAITCWGSRGNGAFVNGRPAAVSTTASLSASLGSALGFLERSEEHVSVQLLKLMKQWDYNYGFMDAFSYVLLAQGKLDVCVNLLDKPWDCAAAACIVTEAGGKFSDISGNRSVHNGSIVLSNGLLHEKTLECFRV